MLKGTGLTRPFLDYIDLHKMKSSVLRYSKIVISMGGFITTVNVSLLLNKSDLKILGESDLVFC